MTNLNIRKADKGVLVPQVNNIFFSHKYLFFIIVAIFLILYGCENPGSIGSQFSDTNPAIVTDSVVIDSLEQIQVEAISGNKPFVTAGIYTDPVFGRYEATALIQPFLPPPLGPAGDSLSTNLDSTQILLSLTIDTQNIWGDTTATGNFQIIEIGEDWNQFEWRYSDKIDLTDNVIGEFSYTDEDSLTIPLADEWKARFISIFNGPDSTRDSTFANQMPGFTIVATNESKLIPISETSRLIIQTNTLTDALQDRLNNTTFAQFAQLATSLERSQEPIFTEEEFELSSTYNNAVYFNLDEIILSLENPVFSGAFYAMHERESLLNNSLPMHHIRPQLESRFFFSSSDTLIADRLINGNSLGFVIGRNQNAQRLQANIKNTVDQILLDSTLTANFNLIYGLNNGIIRSNLYYGTAAASLAPKIFITSLER